MQNRFRIMEPRNEGVGEGYENPFSDSFASEESFGSFSGGMEQRLYSRLMTDGRYADLDKAKHNPQYRSYLMENYESETPF